jgi:membrane protein YqaA with SNARE-associated domain
MDMSKYFFEERISTIIVGVISLLIMILVGYFFNTFKNYKHYGLFGITLLCLVGNIYFMSPAASLVSMIGGRFYNIFLVGLFAAIGCIVGEVLTYNIGSATGEIALKQKNWYEPAKSYMIKNGFLTVFIITCIPNPFVNVSGLLAGSLKYNFWEFLVASFLGNWVQYTITAFIGSLTKKIKS